MGYYFGYLDYPYNKVTECPSVCLYRRISIIAETLLGPGKILTILGDGITTLPREIALGKNFLIVLTKNENFFYFFFLNLQ